MNKEEQLPLDIESAIKTVISDEMLGDNPLPDPINFDFLQSPDKEKIVNLIQEIPEDYQAGPLLKIDVPKENFTIRPMARPEIKDWILYEALVEKIIPSINPNTSDRSFSLLRYKGERKIEAWKKFDEQSRRFFEEGYSHVVVTDISSYFENIDFEELRNLLINLVGENEDDRKIIDILVNNFLRVWGQERIKNFGLPQGPRGSSYLGDVYLSNIDAEMASAPGYIRYMDDIRIFARSETEAKKLLMKIIKALRAYKLNINAKKTKILNGKQVAKELFDPKKPTLDSIAKAIELNNAPAIATITPILFKDVFEGGFSEDNPFAKRHIKFSIFRLGVLKARGIPFDEDQAIRLILENFISNPQHSRIFCQFLTMFPKREDVHAFLKNFLLSRENIYEWQELYVLRYLLEVNVKIDQQFMEILLEKFRDRNKHWIIRGHTALLIGKYGNNRNRELIREEFDHSMEDELKKSIILAIQELGKASRNTFYGTIKRHVWPKELYCYYVKSLKKPMYVRANDWTKIDAEEERYYG